MVAQLVASIVDECCVVWGVEDFGGGLCCGEVSGERVCLDVT